ncbi:MAG: sulfatase [Verrucomicrobiota bacterium]
MRRIVKLVLSSILLGRLGLDVASAAKPNVLFIAVDDLRPELGCYGREQIKSPHIDRLAQRGLLFERTYCQQAICMASRASLMSGYRPDKGEIYRNGPLFSHVPDALTLNQHFMNHGYEAVAMGKIYHHKSDYRQGWSRDWFRPQGAWEGRGYLSPEAQRHVRAYTRKNPKAKRKGMGPAFEAADVPDNAYAEGLIAERAIEELNRLKDKPFFLAVGFVRPHLPFNAPKKYWDLYAEEDIRLARSRVIPKDVPEVALTSWGELRGYHGMPKRGPMPDDLARRLIHGYYACISYVDAMVGRVLEELDRLELREKTIVVLWGDHGWKLGEHGMWCKHTNFELDTRVPLMIRAPGMAAAGGKTMALTELVDIYPTLCDLAGLPKPDHLEGTSMAPLLDDPALPWKQAAFSQYSRGSLRGDSMRTSRYRYTEWRNRKSGKIEFRELYDYDREGREISNLAGDAENRKLVGRLSEMLSGGYQAAKP